MNPKNDSGEVTHACRPPSHPRQPAESAGGRLHAAEIVRAVTLMAWLRTVDDLDPIGLVAPSAADPFHLVHEHLGLVDDGISCEVDVPELPREGAAYDVEAGEVAAMTAPPAVLRVGKRQ